DLPDSLRDAVLRPWHRLSPPARELILALAVGGEVAAGPALHRAARLIGIPAAEAISLLHEAVDCGVLDVTPDGDHWFHHPLQAEVLQSGLSSDERRLLHTAFARECEADLAKVEGPATPARLAATSAIAGHHSQGEHPDQAYPWTLAAAGLADALDDGPALLLLLGRLVVLRAQVDGVDESRMDLLLRLWRAAARVADHEVELGTIELLLAELDEADHPLLVTELLVRQEHMRFSTGRGFFRVEQVERAVALSAHAGNSWQHVYALAELAHASLWGERKDALELADAALRRATALGHPRALAYACAGAAMGNVFSGSPGGVELAARGVAAAVEAGDWWAFVHATLWEANASGAPVSAACVDVDERRRHQMVDLGAPHPYLAWLSACEALGRLLRGDWRGCTDLLRVALGSDPGGAADALARLSAAHVAVLQGRQHEAEDHLTRSDELFAETTNFLAFEFDAVRALVRLGAGDPEGAYAAAMAGATSPGAPPTMCEQLCPLSARALADLADLARERGEPVEPVLARLASLVERFPHVIADSAFLSADYQAQLEALDALYAAEVARARLAPDAADRWEVATDLLDGTLPWDAAYAAYRQAEAIVVGGERPRQGAAAVVRRAHALASELRAEPLLREVTGLARSARIPLDVVGDGGSGSGDGRLQGLTGREREVLDHVVAGRTYGEIARALFVSEKTVSSHVSNLLRKTGTTNRYDLARLARHSTASAPE
ncbi:MAG: helix-turn-helix transcriptional regulator, partial [Ornithinibacter sp.]